MLYHDLAFSATILVAANVAVWRRSDRAPGLIAGMGAPSFLCVMMLPPVMLQTLLTLALYAWHKWRGRTPRQFLLASVGATVLAYAVAGVWVARYQLELREMRERFPFESMEERSPSPPANPEPLRYDEKALELLEYSCGYEARPKTRADLLRRLHDESVENFVKSPGFGMVRMMQVPSAGNLTYDPRPGPAPPQPGGALSPPLPALKLGTLAGLHAEAALEFAYPEGFGYFRDRTQVAGFRSHRFGQLPPVYEPVAVVRIELVSLLMHDAPAVYVSPNLPAMDELAGVPTRPLDDFEADGLAKLRAGDELVVDGARMLGSLRSARQCAACHGGERGELLGALSYWLRGR